MHAPYNERFCMHCHFKGKVTDQIPIFKSNGMRYVECLRDNEDAKEHFMKTLKDENFLWLRQVAEFERCIYDFNSYGWTFSKTGFIEK